MWLLFRDTAECLGVEPTTIQQVQVPSRVAWWNMSFLRVFTREHDPAASNTLRYLIAVPVVGGGGRSPARKMDQRIGFLAGYGVMFS